MTVRTARRLTVLWVVLATVLLTWPAILPFNRIEPRLLGLPFVIVWVALWIVLGFVVLLIADRAVTRAERASGRED
jgi:hypothetical protein